MRCNFSKFYETNEFAQALRNWVLLRARVNLAARIFDLLIIQNSRHSLVEHAMRRREHGMFSYQGSSAKMFQVVSLSQRYLRIISKKTIHLFLEPCNYNWCIGEVSTRSYKIVRRVPDKEIVSVPPLFR